MAVAVRLHRFPGEVLALPVSEYALLLAHFAAEAEDSKLQDAKAKSADSYRKMLKGR